jgi:hypothetical protein
MHACILMIFNTLYTCKALARFYQQCRSDQLVARPRTVGQVNIQASASEFWSKQMHQTWARLPEKITQARDYLEALG